MPATIENSDPIILSSDQLERLHFLTEKAQVLPSTGEQLMQLGQLFASEYAQWAHLFSERHCAPGEVIFWEDEPGDSMYVIQSGNVTVIKGDLSTPVVLDCHTRGECIGEMALLEKSPRSATVVALDEVHLLEIDRENFFNLLRASDTFSRNIMRLLSARLRGTSNAVQRETQQKMRDPLTGLYNRYYLKNVFPHELQRAARAGYTVCLLMINIDYFKEVNDIYGHLAGDRMLQAFGSLLRSLVRRADVACRYGGEEFLILLPEVSLEVALSRAETIRLQFEALEIEHNGKIFQRTLSVSVACFPDHGNTPEALIDAADRALYRAKARGRNQVVAASPI